MGLVCIALKKHCDNCLVSVYTDKDGKKKKRYYHKVLEAKLVLSDKIVISMDTEFIENESEHVLKQDCEMNAAKRKQPISLNTVIKRKAKTKKRKKSDSVGSPAWN